MNQTCSIKLHNPFSIKWVMAHIQTSSYGVPYTSVSEARLRRLIVFQGRSRLVEYDFRRRRNSGFLKAVLLGGSDPEGSRENSPTVEPDDLRDLSRFIFGLDDDLKACYAALNGTAQIQPLVRRYRGLRMLRTPDLYESLLIAILGQQVSVASAQAQRKRLMATFGERISYEGRNHPGIPKPERLLEAGEKRLRDTGLTRQKARYLFEAARQIAEDRISRQSLRGVTCEQAVERLMEIPGVGRWTAEIVAMKGLGFPDVFPAGDLGLQMAAERIFNLPRRPSERELRDIASRWDGWRSYAAFYLWMTLMDGGYA